jgi:hypothetical protein
MSDSRAFASLSSGLLARKGGAKPAMRPQGFGQMGIEDLGWNDMGYGTPPDDPQDNKPGHTPSSIAALTPAPRPQVPSSDMANEAAATPVVIEQQRTIAATFGEAEPAGGPTSKRKRKSAAIVALPPQAPQGEPVKARDKTAFTLRLDAERHLRLRLACAVTGRSAQQIVTGALDEFLASLPELTAMAEQVPAKFGKRS